MRELDAALAERNADYAVLVVASDEKVPAKMPPLREYNGDKLIVTFDPEEGPLALQVAYTLARARVLMARGDGEGIDGAAVRDTVERALWPTRGRPPRQPAAHRRRRRRSTRPRRSSAR